jgi:adenylate cyclase
VRVFRVLLDGNSPTLRTKPRFRGNYWRSALYSLAGVAIIFVIVVLVRRITLKEPRTNASIPPQESPGPQLPSMPSIAVLPFTNLSGDPKQEYFSDGITGQIISELSRLPGLFVIARNSSFSYKGKTVTEQQVGRDLGVKYILEGSVQKTADRIRIGAELVDSSSGIEMWSQQYDRPIKDIFVLQDEIAEEIVTTLGLILKQEEMKVPHGAPALRTENLEAFDDLLRAGEYFTRFTREDHLKERAWLEKAIAVDPTYSQAYALLAGNYSSGVLFGWSENPAEDFAHATSLAQKALTLDDSHSYALAKLCEIHWQQKRYDQAIAECERVVALDPNSADGYLELADAAHSSK